MKTLTFILSHAFLAVCVFGKKVHNEREGRWFRHTYTETKVQKEIVTSLVPSSCVHVEATLPPCRSVRNLQPFPEFGGTQIYPEYMKGRQLAHPQNPINQNKPQIVLAPVNASKSVGWGEYLGLVAPTVTVTAIELHTTTVVDPRAIVTFSVKGCRPSRLPLDLDRCPSNSPHGFSIEEISPTSTVLNVVAPTARSANLNIDYVRGNDINLKKSKNIEIEPSTEELVEGSLSSIATEELSNVEITK